MGVVWELMMRREKMFMSAQWRFRFGLFDKEMGDMRIDPGQSTDYVDGNGHGYFQVPRLLIG